MSVVSVNEAILQIEKALDQAPGALSFCVEHFPYSAFLLDPTGTVLYANRHAQENLGRTDGMIGKKCREIICRHKKDPDDCPLKTVQKMENPSCRRVMESAFGNYRSHLEPLMDSAGKLLGTILSLSLCPGGAALRESSEPVEDPYKLLFVSSSNGVLLLDRLGKIVDVNPGFCSMFKVELSEVLGQQIPWFSRFCKNGGALVPEIIEGIMRGEKSIAPTVLELVRPDGRPVIVEFSARALQRDDTTVGIQVIYQDITQSEEAKKALELSEERYRAMFEAIDSGVAVYEAVDGGSDFIFKNFNGAAEKITKLDRGSALGTRLLEHFPHMDKTPLVAALRRVYETGISEDLPPFFYKDDVREGWRANTIYRLPTGEVVAVFTDVTRQVENELILRRSENRLKMALEAAMDGIWDCDFVTGEAYFSPRYCQILGYPADAFTGHKDGWSDLIHPDDRSRVLESLNKCLRGRDHFEAEYRMRHKDGSWVWILGRGQAIEWNGQGTPIRLTGTHRDISSGKNAQELVRKKNQRISNILRSLPQFIAYIDADLRFQFANDAYGRVFGFNPGDLEGKAITEMMPEEDYNFLKPYIDRVLKGDEARYYRELNVGGLTRQILGHFLPDVDENNVVHGYFTVLTDISDLRSSEEERERLQQQLLHSQKLDSLGRLAGGVAHDFNNLLTSILMNVEFALEMVGENEDLAETLSDVKLSAESATSLTRQLLTFSQKQPATPSVIDLAQAVERSGKMLNRLMGDNIQLIVRGGDEKCFVYMDEGHMDQILMNLLVNASHAMPEGGSVSINTTAVALAEDFMGTRCSIPAGEYVVLSVADTGVGMDVNVMGHIFEPFFTTRSSKKGTGLGLSTVYGIVTQAKGFIDVASTVGEGTTFTIYLPQVNFSEQRTGSDSTIKALDGHETILLVEDEEMVRGLTQRILEGAGYRVLPFESGNELMAQWDSIELPVHLLLTDIRMPGIDGEALANEITTRSPGIRVLYVSGYSMPHLMEDFAKDSPGFLAKPFTAVSLLQKVREVLAQV